MPGNRRLLVLAAAVLAVLALAGGVLAGRGGAGDDAAPARATLALVPARALAVVHLSTDGDRSSAEQAGELARRLPSWPGLRRDLLRRIEAPGCGIDLEARPGREVTLALLRSRGGAAQPLLLTDAPSEGLGDATQPCGALVVRRVGDLVAIGEPDAVLAARELADGRGRALADDPAFRRAAAGLPADRVADAWVSQAGARRLLVPLGGALGTVGGLIDTPGLVGAALALVPEAQRDAARIVMRRVTEEASRTPPFAPTLQDRAPRDAIAYVASGDIAGALQGLLVLGGDAAAGVVPDLLQAGGAPLDTLGDLGRESAVVVAPSPDGPALTLLSRMRDPVRARAAMTDLEVPLAQALGAPDGVTWADAQLGGRGARSIAVAPGQALAWALDGDVLVVSTATAGVAAARPGAGLGDTAGWRRVAGDLPRRLTSLVFLDPNQVLRLGEGTGIGPGDALQGVGNDLARVRAVGAHASGSGSLSTVELSLWIP